MATGSDRDRETELLAGNLPVPEHACTGNNCWCTGRPFPNPDWQE
jgi:hypothetical protein